MSANMPNLSRYTKGNCMNYCLTCGKSKPNDAVLCPSCKNEDKEVVQSIGMPSLTITVIVLLGLWLYRFWFLGWSAIPGNLRVAALTAMCLGSTGILFGPLWTFGIRSRKKAFRLFLVGLLTFLLFNSI
jgi:predicted nucleic acid-binding Zn ribbon protein